MPKGIVKLTDEDDRKWFFEWSTVVDAPVTYRMTRDELYRYMKEQYGLRGLKGMPERMRRADQTGTSFFNWTVEDVLSGNRAGENESEISAQEIIERYKESP